MGDGNEEGGGRGHGGEGHGDDDNGGELNGDDRPYQDQVSRTMTVWERRRRV